MVLLCVGVLLAGLTFHGSADSYVVNAVVPAALPSGPATITAPADQAHFTSKPIAVSGTCPENTYVKLLRNGVLSGIANCAVGQTTFQIDSDLFPGANTLLAQVYNITDQAGPASSPITVFYDVPTPASNTGSSAVSVTTTTPTALATPAQKAQASPLSFFVKYDYQYQPLISGKSFSLDLSLEGGTNPYAVTILWGDSSESTLVRNDRSQFSVGHTYRLSGKSQQTFRIRIQAVDSQGATAFLEIAELVRGGGPSAQIPFIGNINTPSSSQLIRLAWPAYGVTTLMVLSFWLGERQEYGNIFRRKALRRRA